MVFNTPWSYNKFFLKNTRRTLKNSTLCPTQRFKHKSMRNGVEEEKEWRISISLFFDQYLGCIFMAIPSSSYDILNYVTLDEALILFLKWDLLTTWVVRVFSLLNFPYNYFLDVLSLIKASLSLHQWNYIINIHIFKMDPFSFLIKKFK